MMFERIFVLCVVLCVILIGNLIFLSGFLLSRTALNTTAKASFVEFPNSEIRRAVWIVIDALRLDFAIYDDKVMQPSAYQNKLTVIRDLLRGKPENSRLYRFIADPPTTTMQRIKGLTTGSLPTFVDAGSNFASAEITEDNIIDSLIRTGHNITFMGDDTWTGLFPDRFHPVFPFPSFNVKDLHTVDNGVISRLPIALPLFNRMNSSGSDRSGSNSRMDNWSLLIAHFLGVDHCGHRFGPNHPAMAEKLQQMDEVIRRIILSLPNDTILFVFGDHGMTKSGDHGGDSDAEIIAALFVYSPLSVFHHRPDNRLSTVAQIDLVPTTALLLGVPVPYSNLGRVIPDLFTGSRNLLVALRANALQVHQYLKAYSAVSTDLSHKHLQRLHELFEKAEVNYNMFTKFKALGEDSVQSACDMYTLFLSESKDVCQGIWAEFDTPLILLGSSVVLLGTTLLLNFFLVICNLRKEVFPSPFYTIVALLTLGFCWLSPMVHPLITMVSQLFATVLFLLQAVANIYQTLLHFVGLFKIPGAFRCFAVDMVTMALLGISSMSFLSNSFVVHENTSSFFLAQSALIIFVMTDLRECGLSEDGEVNGSNSRERFRQRKKGLGLILICMAISRASWLFWTCREEQGLDCDVTTFLQPLSSLGSNGKNLRYFTSCSALIVSGVVLYLWLRHCGNWNGQSPGMLFITFALPASVICVCFHWALQALPVKVMDSLSPWQQMVMAQLAYLGVFVSLAALLLDPLLIYRVKPSHHVNRGLSQTLLRSRIQSGSNMIPEVFSQMRSNWQQHMQHVWPLQSSAAPVVYGLGTVFSANLLTFTFGFSVMVAILLGDGMALSVFFMLVSIVIHAELISSGRRSVQPTSQSWAVGAIWCLLSSHWFFATGHHTTVPNIRFEAAFQGFVGDFQVHALPATMIALNTFASEALFGLALPLTTILCKLPRKLINCTSIVDDSRLRGEFDFLNEERKFSSGIFRSASVYIVCHILKLICAIFAATLHRRHLMVWKIFAPKLVYQMTSWLVTSLFTILGLLIVSRTHSCLIKWISKL